MNKDNFEYLPASVIDALYEEPEELNVFSFDDFLNLPLNDGYIKENEDAKDFSKYKPKISEEKEKEKKDEDNLKISTHKVKFDTKVKEPEPKKPKPENLNVSEKK